MASSSLRAALAAVALLVILGAPQGSRATHGRIRAHVKEFLHESKVALTATERCVRAKGVPMHLLKKAVKCGSLAAAGPHAYLLCAGLASLPEAAQSIHCFGSAVKNVRQQHRRAKGK